MGADPWKVLGQARAKLKLHSAAVQVPIGAEGGLAGLVDLVKEEAVYFEGANGYAVLCAAEPWFIISIGVVWSKNHSWVCKLGRFFGGKKSLQTWSSWRQISGVS